MTNDKCTRHEGLVTSLSWIPSEAIESAERVAFDAGITRYDVPPPDELTDLEQLRDTDRFRFANVLRAWIDVDPTGKIVDCGYTGGGMIGSTTVSLAGLHHTFQAVKLPDLQREPERGDGWVRFSQTVGGRTGLPAPRRVRRKPYIQWRAPLVWTTLSLTIHTDGRTEHAMTGASRFPRHWVYDGKNLLSHKSGLTDFKDWYQKSFGRFTPWGDEELEALVTAVESALERTLSTLVMKDAHRSKIHKFPAGSILFKQGDQSSQVLLVLDGVVRVERDGERLAEYGPGAILGERAHLEGGIRTSTNVAVTACRVAMIDAEVFDRSNLENLSEGHRREEQTRN